MKVTETRARRILPFVWFVITDTYVGGELTQTYFGIKLGK
jgi:hypothetical protein